MLLFVLGGFCGPVVGARIQVSAIPIPVFAISIIAISCIFAVAAGTVGTISRVFPITTRTWTIFTGSILVPIPIITRG